MHSKYGKEGGKDDDGAGDLSGASGAREGTDVKRQMKTSKSEWKRRRKVCNFKSNGGVNNTREEDGEDNSAPHNATNGSMPDEMKQGTVYRKG